MKNFTRFILSGACFCAPLIVAEPALAQQLKGQYSPAPKVAEEETLDVVVPRIFSSQVVNVKAGEKLDADYYNLSVLLEGFAEIDRSYKEALFELLQPHYFQVTRRAAEFRKDLETANNSLKENHKKIQDAIESFVKSYDVEAEKFSPQDKEILASMKDKAIKGFKDKSEAYFQRQAKFLKVYSALVRFILKNGGSYYYDSASKGVAFYQAGHYKYFGKLVDQLNELDYQQAQILKTTYSVLPL